MIRKDGQVARVEVGGTGSAARPTHDPGQDLSGKAGRVWLRPCSGARADWKVTSATPVDLPVEDLGLYRVDRCPLAGFFRSEADLRVLLQAGVTAEMIPEWRPFQSSMPVWRGW